MVIVFAHKGFTFFGSYGGANGSLARDTIPKTWLMRKGEMNGRAGRDDKFFWGLYLYSEWGSSSSS